MYDSPEDVFVVVMRVDALRAKGVAAVRVVGVLDPIAFFHASVSSAAVRLLRVRVVVMDFNLRYVACFGRPFLALSHLDDCSSDAYAAAQAVGNDDHKAFRCICTFRVVRVSEIFINSDAVCRVGELVNQVVQLKQEEGKAYAARGGDAYVGAEANAACGAYSQRFANRDVARVNLS